MVHSKTPIITVIVHAFKHGQFLRDCLESIVSQSYKNLHIVVIENGSNDGSDKIIREFKSKDSRIVDYILKDHIGIAKSFNLGLELIKGPYVCNFSGDDIMFPEKIEKQYRTLESNLDCDVCFHDVEVFDSESNNLLFRWLDKFSPTKRVQDALFVADWFFRKKNVKTPSASWFARTEYFKSGKNDHRTSNYHEFIMGMGFLNYNPYSKWITIPEVLGRYRRHPSNLSNSNFDWLKIAEEITVCYGIARVRYPEYAKKIIDEEAYWWFSNLLYNRLPENVEQIYRLEFRRKFGWWRWLYLYFAEFYLRSKVLIKARSIFRNFKLNP